MSERLLRSIVLLSVVVCAAFTLPFNMEARADQESNVIEPSVLESMIGKNLNSPEVVSFLGSFNGPAEITGPYFDGSIYYSWHKDGISVMFQSDILISIFFYAENTDGYAQYKGDIPYGLTFSDTRQSIEQKFGAAKISGGRGIIPFWVVYPDLGFGITYKALNPNDMSTTSRVINIQKPKTN